MKSEWTKKYSKFLTFRISAHLKRFSFQDTVLRTACYAPDTGSMDANQENTGFSTRQGFFLKDDEGNFKEKPVSFLGNKIIF